MNHIWRIINRLEAMTKDGGNRNVTLSVEGVVVAEVAFNHDEEKV